MLSLEDEISQFYAELGKALSEFGKVEDGVFHIFWKALKTGHHNASAVFYSVISSPTRLDMTDAALRARTADEAILNEWGLLAKKVRKLGKMRAPLAHYHVTQFPQAEPGDRVFLKPSAWNVSWYTADMITIHTVRDRAATFKESAKKLRAFADRVHELPEPIEPLPPPRLDNMTPRSLRRLLPRTPDTPPQSSQE
jgi:hypothetical protein